MTPPRLRPDSLRSDNCQRAPGSTPPLRTILRQRRLAGLRRARPQPHPLDRAARRHPPRRPAHRRPHRPRPRSLCLAGSSTAAADPPFGYLATGPGPRRSPSLSPGSATSTWSPGQPRGPARPPTITTRRQPRPARNVQLNEPGTSQRARRRPDNSPPPSAQPRKPIGGPRLSSLA